MQAAREAHICGFRGKNTARPARRWTRSEWMSWSRSQTTSCPLHCFRPNISMMKTAHSIEGIISSPRFKPEVVARTRKAAEPVRYCCSKRNHELAVMQNRTVAG